MIGGKLMKKTNLKKFLHNLMTLTMVCALILSTFTSTYATGDSTVDGILKEVVTVLLTVAGFLCVCKIIHIGISYMTSSAADKSTAKQALLPWLVGTIVCFGAAIIGGAIIDLFRQGLPPNVLEY